MEGTELRDLLRQLQGKECITVGSTPLPAPLRALAWVIDVPGADAELAAPATYPWLFCKVKYALENASQGLAGVVGKAGQGSPG